MILHLNYQVDKEYYKKIFYDNYDKGGYHKEGDVVLDPYSGSGNICLASTLLGRDYIGIEIDEKYYDESLNNLKRMYLRYEKQKWI